MITLLVHLAIIAGACTLGLIIDYLAHGKGL